MKRDGIRTYNYYVILIFSLLTLIHAPSFGLENKDFWYKVEPKKETDTKTKVVPQYTFDSIESETSSRHSSPSYFWGRQSRVHLGGGFFYDRTWRQDEHNKPWLLVAGWTFRDQGWNRMSLDGWFTFRSHFVLNAIWQFMGSRKAFRSFYGLGFSFDWRAQSEIRAFVELKNYWFVANYGYEYLINQKKGIRIEVRASIGSENYGLSLLTSYILRL